MTPLDDISHARLCARCHRWGPEEANFCGHCGLQLWPLPPLAPPIMVLDKEARRRKRRARRLLAGGVYGPIGVVGVRLGEGLTGQHDEDRRGR